MNFFLDFILLVTEDYYREIDKNLKLEGLFWFFNHTISRIKADRDR